MKLYDKYVKLKAIENKVRQEFNKLNYNDITYCVSITPDHCNGFYLILNVKGNTASLPIDNARKLAKWILENTEENKDYYNIRSDIGKKKIIIDKTK